MRLQARLAGLREGTTHSFHFHQLGDMTVDLNARQPPWLGPIYSGEGISLSSFETT